MLRISCRKGTSVVAASASGPWSLVYLGVFVLLVLVSRKRDAVYSGHIHVSGNSHKLPESKERYPHLWPKPQTALLSMFALAAMGSESHHQWAAEL